MLPDTIWGSDYDYAEAMGTHDEPAPDDHDEDEPSEADDEEMGAALAARFEVTR